MDETPRPDYETPTVNVSAPGYAAGLTPYDFGGSVDFWTTNLYLRYHKTSPATEAGTALDISPPTQILCRVGRKAHSGS
jgi:hypothetical protein